MDLCAALGMPGRFEEGPSREPRLYKLSFVPSSCSEHKFTNVRMGSGSGGWLQAVAERTLL